MCFSVATECCHNKKGLKGQLVFCIKQMIRLTLSNRQETNISKHDRIVNSILTGSS